MSTKNAQRVKRHKLRQREKGDRPAEVRAAFDAMKITISVEPSTAAKPTRTRVDYDFATVADWESCEAYAARLSVDLRDLLDDHFRSTAARYLKGPSDESDWQSGAKGKGWTFLLAY